MAITNSRHLQAFGKHVLTRLAICDFDCPTTLYNSNIAKLIDQIVEPASIFRAIDLGVSMAIVVAKALTAVSRCDVHDRLGSGIVLSLSLCLYATKRGYERPTGRLEESNCSMTEAFSGAEVGC